MARQLQELDYHPNVIGGAGLMNKSFLDMVTEEQVNGWYSVGETSLTSTIEGYPEFMAAYVGKYGSDPESPAICVYAGLQLLKQVIEETGSAASADIAEGLRAIAGCQTIIGSMYCDEKQNMLHNTFIKQLHNKKEELITMIEESR